MIEDFGLHDAALVAVHFVWADGTCIMTVRHSQLSDCTLTFTGVSSLTLPRTQPWGPSQSINSASERNKGQYEIELQSGDLIKIDASDVGLSSIATGGLEARAPGS
jgi:hypothetical protein